MRSRLLPALAAGLLTLSLLGPVSAAADDRERTGPTLPEQASDTARERAEDALARAQAVFAERSPAAAKRILSQGGGDATMALNQLMRVYDELVPSQQREADALFARPADPDGDTVQGATFAYEHGEEEPVCGGTVCIHYASQPDVDAPPSTDVGPANGIPDAVDRSLAVAEQVHTTYVEAGYQRPEGDGMLGGEGADLVDIYLADTGSAGLYGYCTADEQQSGPPYHLPAYCVVDNDFASTQFGTRHTPLENLQVTVAHEYFHAVQFAYDAFEDGWIMEATATWAEDELFDDVNDNRQYLRYGQLRKPRIPLDNYGGLGHYGNWVFIRYLTERWPARTGDMPTLVLDVWKRLDARTGRPDQYSTQALQHVLSRRNTSFTTVYGQFSDANRRPARTYEEGTSYPTARPAESFLLSTSKRSIGNGWYATLDHLTSLPLRFRPDTGLRKRDWKLRITVDMPPLKTAPVARVATYLKTGEVDTSTIRLKKTGASRTTVGFSARDVRYVELVLVNASRRTGNCWSDSPYACQGQPRDDNRRTDFKASIFRR